MVVSTRSGEHEHESEYEESVTPGGLCAALQNPDVSETAKKRAVRKLDGIADGEDMPGEVERAAGAAVSAGGKGEGTEEEEMKEENDLDPETVRNTHANECMTPKRMLRRRASSQLNASPDSADGSSSAGSPPKHVGFVDETDPGASVLPLAGHKAALRNPRASEVRKENAREVLAFHGEACE